MRIGAIYVRKSKQTGKGESIKNQIDICKDYAIDNDILIEDYFIYHDEGYSGRNTERPEFKRMINDLKNGKFNVLMCYRLDRISRSLRDFSDTIKLLDEFKVSFISIKEQFDTTTPMGTAMMYIASVFSQLERETIAERIRDNLSSLAKMGRWLGGTTPTGFISKPIIFLDSDMNRKKMYKLSPVKKELYIVSLIFEKYLEFESLSKLEDYCLKNNLKSKNNLSFSKTTLKQIITNPVYCVADKSLYNYLASNNFYIANDKAEFNGEYGVLTYKSKDDIIASIAKHKGIIESKYWLKIQDMLLSNRMKPYRQGTSTIGVLSGLIKCYECGSIMRVKYGRKTTRGVIYYYVCTLKEKSRKLKCNSRNLKGFDTDSLIIDTLNNFFIDNTFTKHLFEEVSYDYKSFLKVSTSESDNTIFRDKLKIYHYKLDTLSNQLSYNKDSSASKYILEQIESLNKKIGRSKQNSSLLGDTENKLVNYSNYEFNINNLSFEDKKYLLNKVITYIDWNSSVLDIKLK